MVGYFTDWGKPPAKALLKHRSCTQPTAAFVSELSYAGEAKGMVTYV